MPISKRHHYIPQFFIKGFTDDDELLWIYDKKYDKILKDKKSTKSIFFGENINSVTLNNQKFDLIEKFYSGSDNYFAKKICKIRDELVDDIETTESSSILDVFILFLFWRRYSNNDTVNETASMLIHSLESIINFDKSACNEHLSKDDMDKLKKSILAFSILKDDENKIIENKTGHYKILNFKEPFYFISDNPVIFDRLPSSSKSLIESFKIFPISKYRIYLGFSESGYTLTIEQSKLINLILIDQADRYVGSFSKEYLESFVNVYRKLNQKEEMFSYLKERLIKEINSNDALHTK